MPGDLISVDEARERVLQAVRALGPERVAAADALDRVLAEDVAGELDLLPFDSSAMDGYALVAGAAGELPVVGESRAGTPFTGSVEAGQAIRISTGAVIPEGADAVVPIERVELLDADAGAGAEPGAGADASVDAEPGAGVRGVRVRVPATEPGANVRRAGDDIRAGDVVLRAGDVLGPAALGMLAAVGRTHADCSRRPRVALIATGDELVPAGEPLGPGQIHDSNAAALAAQATRAGAVVVGRASTGDTRAKTIEALDAALERAEVVVVSGGVSVGPHDHVRPALAELGVEQLVSGVRLKPGKPFYFGVRERDGERNYLFGLPGNPVSAMVTFQLFARPALRALQGADTTSTRSTAVLDAPIAPNPERDQAIRCRLRMAADGWHAEPTGAQGSHVLSSMLGAGALALVPAGDREIATGERVEIELL